MLHPGCTTRASYGEEDAGNRSSAHGTQRKARSFLMVGPGVTAKEVVELIAWVQGEGGTAMGTGSGGRQRNRAPSPTPSEASPGRSRATNKRARRSAGGGDLRPVRVKREEVGNRVPDDENNARAGRCGEDGGHGGVLQGEAYGRCRRCTNGEERKAAG